MLGNITKLITSKELNSMKQNLYLIKSTYERNETGDVIIDLNRIMSIRCYKVDCYILSMDYTETDRIHAKFDTEEELRAELSNIFTAMGCEDKLSLVARIKTTDKSAAKDKLKEMLRNLS